MDTLLASLFTGLVASLFLNIKLPISNHFSYYLGEKKDLFVIFAYLSDILLICFITCSIYASYKRHLQSNGLNKRNSLITLGVSILALLSYYSHFSQLLIPTISLYYLLYIAKSIVLHETVVREGRRLFPVFSMVFVALLSGESLLAIYQFSQQRNFGMQWIGEPVLIPYIYGPAKVVALGQESIRAYGTFPHPNVFAAFLVIGIALGIKLALDKAISANRWKYLFAIFLINLYAISLILTFSRAAWLTTVLMVVGLLVFTWNKAEQQLRPKIMLIYGSLIVCVATTLFILFPLIQQRSNIFDEAYQERQSYNSVAVRIIKNNPILGLGTGESLLHMEQLLGTGFNTWQVQPIHNYYLLLATEIGLPALFLFLWYVIRIGWSGIKKAWQEGYNDGGTAIYLTAGLCACLILMLFDHYFYTIQATVLLFWIWLGLTASEVTHETGVAHSNINL